MEISVTFQAFVLFLTVLIFSRSFAMFARQDPGRVEPETAAEQDEEVKRVAEQDARRDFKKLFWLAAGVGTFCLASFMGISGCLVGGVIFPAEGGLDFMPMLDFSDWAIMIGCISFVAGILIPCIGIHRGGVSLPPDRLLEKPPEYVEFYTDAYSAKTRSLRLRWALAGVGAVVGGFLLLGLLSL